MQGSSRTLRDLNVDEYTRIVIRADANVDQRVFNAPIISQVQQYGLILIVLRGHET